MSNENKTPCIDDNDENGVSKKQKRTSLSPEKLSSPPMFEEASCSVDVYSQYNQTTTFNQVISIRMVSPERQISSQNNLSTTPTEHVTACPHCNEKGFLETSTKDRNQSVTQTTLDIDDELPSELLETITGYSIKRAQLNELSKMAENISVKLESKSTDASDFLINLIDDQVKVINEQLTSLQEDSEQHLMMANFLNCATDN